MFGKNRYNLNQCSFAKRNVLQKILPTMTIISLVNCDVGKVV